MARLARLRRIARLGGVRPGFDPRDPRNREFEVTYRVPSPQRLKPPGGRFRNLRGPFRCSVECDVQISGYATSGGWRERGLRLTGSFGAPGEATGPVGFDFTRRERRILAAMFRRHGSVQYLAPSATSNNVTIGSPAAADPHRHT